MMISQLDVDALTDEQIKALLFPAWEQNGESGDCIFVFGCTAFKGRVEKAASLYHARMAPRVLVSGGTRFGKTMPPEAHRMRDYLMALGVPSTAILVEDDSNHTKENVIASLLVLDRNLGLQNVQRILFVSTLAHLRRCFLTLKTFLPDWIECVPHSAQGEGRDAEAYWSHDRLRDFCRQEAKDIVRFVKGRYIVDAEL